MDILSYIPYGKENAVSRYRIAEETGIDEREIRKAVKQANRELEGTGEAILSSSGARGYWRTANVVEMERYLRESDHRRMEQARNDFPIRRIVCRARGESMVWVKGHFRKIRVNPAQIKL